MKIKNIVLWVLTLFFVLATIVYVTSPGAALTGILCLLCSILCCPAIHKKLKDIGKMPRKRFLIATALILIFASTMVMPETKDADSASNIKVTKENNNSDNNSITDTPTSENNKTINTAENTDKEAVREIEDKSLIIPVADKYEITESTQLKIHFLDVGQGDAIIVEADKHFMVVDAGENGDGDFVVNYLNDLGAKTLDYVIGTHPHEDHVGGLDDVINSFDVNTVIMPEVTTTTDTFVDVLDAISNKGLSITAPVVGDEYEIGDAMFTIIASNRDYEDNLNDWSFGIKLTNGINSFVMCGDAELESEYDICDNAIDLNANVLKIGHHGSDTSTSEAILKAVKPSYAVISVGKGNQYGHPALETLQRLKDEKIAYFRTDKQGTIICTSDGTNIT